MILQGVFKDELERILKDKYPSTDPSLLHHVAKRMRQDGLKVRIEKVYKLEEPKPVASTTKGGN